MGQEPSSQVTNYQFQSTQDNLVAKGSNQATAFLLAGQVNYGAMLNRFTTVPLGSGCVLPAAVSGLSIGIINSGANPLQVYGLGGDTINGVAGSSGVPMMVNSFAFFQCLTTGQWFTVDLGQGFVTSAQGAAVGTFSTQSGITASTTHSAAGGVPIVASQAEIHTCANSGDAVTLPPAQAGMQITIVNNGANPAGVYPSGTDQINNGGAGVVALQANATVLLYFCFVAGLWVTK